MPKVRPSQEELELVSFFDPNQWSTSKKGNLWRIWQGVTLTIFPDRYGDGFSWCIADGEEVRYSPTPFGSEEDAMYSMGEKLGVGE